jgi:hypothetical protein
MSRVAGEGGSIICFVEEGLGLGACIDISKAFLCNHRFHIAAALLFHGPGLL